MTDEVKVSMPEPVMVNMELRDFIQIVRIVNDSQNPKVTLTSSMIDMQAEAKKIVENNLRTLSLILVKYNTTEYDSKMETPPVPVYGYCPICGAPGISRERRPGGNDKCEKLHTYPSRDSISKEEMDFLS